MKDVDEISNFLERAIVGRDYFSCLNCRSNEKDIN